MRNLKLHLWPTRRRLADPAVLRDAERLIKDHGEQAYQAAGLMSWREDVGLLRTDKPGHWHRVRLAVAQRTGTHSEEENQASSTIQMLHLI